VSVLTPAEGTVLYAKLRADVFVAGILDRDYRYYAIQIAGVALALAVSLFCLIRLPVSWALVACAVAVALLGVQLCGIIHDAGHRAVYGRLQRPSSVASTFGDGTPAGSKFADGLPAVTRQQRPPHHGTCCVHPLSTEYLW
jgi:hypothetical protein